MRPIRPVALAVVAATTLLCASVFVASPSASVSQGSCPFMSVEEAADAMDTATATLVRALGNRSAGNCVFQGLRKGASPTHGLNFTVFRPGRAGLSRYARDICKFTASACKFALAAASENDPVRLMRLLYAAAQEHGDAFQLRNAFPGPGPAFLWDPAPPYDGSVVVFYVTRQKQFVSVVCHANYKPAGRADDCAVQAARDVNTEISIR